MKNGISVILTAWNTQEYIKECLDSIYKQSFFKNDNYEVILGIDACEKTLKKVKEILPEYPNLKVFYFKENVGTYIISNTLATFAQYKYIFRFDTDDIMMPNAVKELYEYAEKNKTDMIRGQYRIFYASTGKSVKTTKLVHGQMFIKTETLLKFGGFRPFKCAADSELALRLKKFIKIDFPKIEICLHRIHTSNLTVRNETGMESKYRKNIRAFFQYEVEKSLKTKSDAVIKCVTAPCYALDENGDVSATKQETNFIPAEIVDLYETFMNLPESERKKYYKKDQFPNSPIMMTSTGYIRKRAQSGWIGYM